MYNTILVPVGSGTLSKDAAKHAFKLAEEQNATVHILHAITPYEPNKGETSTPEQSPLYDDSCKLLTEYEDLATDYDIQLTTKLLIGHPHAAILNYEDEINPDLIIMATHGRSGIERIVIGSITEDVIRNAHSPVLTVN